MPPKLRSTWREVLNSVHMSTMYQPAPPHVKDSKKVQQTIDTVEEAANKKNVDLCVLATFLFDDIRIEHMNGDAFEARKLFAFFLTAQDTPGLVPRIDRLEVLLNLVDMAHMQSMAVSDVDPNPSPQTQRVQITHPDFLSYAAVHEKALSLPKGSRIVVTWHDNDCDAPVQWTGIVIRAADRFVPARVEYQVGDSIVKGSLPHRDLRVYNVRVIPRYESFRDEQSRVRQSRASTLPEQADIAAPSAAPTQEALTQPLEAPTSVEPPLDFCPRGFSVSENGGLQVQGLLCPGCQGFHCISDVTTIPKLRSFHEALMSDQWATVRWAVGHKIIRSTQQCPQCSGKMSIARPTGARGVRFVCSDANCRTSQSLRSELREISILCCLPMHLRISRLPAVMLVARKTLDKVVSDFARLCSLYSLSRLVLCGRALQGPVAWDETHLSSRKHQRGKRVRQSGAIIVGGGVELDENGRVLRGSASIVRDHSAKSLMRALVSHVSTTGASLITDAHKAYSRAHLLWPHFVVNHSRHFTDEVGTTTNQVEGFWSLMKKVYRGYFGKLGTASEIPHRIQLSIFFVNMSLANFVELSGIFSLLRWRQEMRESTNDPCEELQLDVLITQFNAILTQAGVNELKRTMPGEFEEVSDSDDDVVL